MFFNQTFLSILSNVTRNVIMTRSGGYIKCASHPLTLWETKKSIEGRSWPHFALLRLVAPWAWDFLLGYTSLPSGSPKLGGRSIINIAVVVICTRSWYLEFALWVFRAVTHWIFWLILPIIDGICTGARVYVLLLGCLCLPSHMVLRSLFFDSTLNIVFSWTGCCFLCQWFPLACTDSMQLY